MTTTIYFAQKSVAWTDLSEGSSSLLHTMLGIHFQDGMLAWPQDGTGYWVKLSHDWGQGAISHKLFAPLTAHSLVPRAASQGSKMEPLLGLYHLASDVTQFHVTMVTHLLRLQRRGHSTAT